MRSPARDHFIQVQARKAAGTSGTAEAPAGVALATGGTVRADSSPPGPIARMQGKLVSDTARLKSLRSVEAKIEAKRQLLPDYAAYVAGVLEANAGGDDAIVTTIMIWSLDIGDWGLGLDLAEYALRHKLTLPERFERPVAELVLETVAEAALAAIEDKEADQALADALERATQLTDGIDMPDQIRAKAEKAAGLMLVETAPEQAVKHLRQALKLNRAIGVKKLVEQLEKKLQLPVVQKDPGADGAG